MKIVALLGVRNEEKYIELCLKHLIANGIEVVLIDNESTDQTVEKAKQFLGQGLIGIETFPYMGFYDWIGMLTVKQNLAASMRADWYIHHDADEIRHASPRFSSLREGIKFVDEAGYSAIDFNEFVFIPKDDEVSDDGCDYVAALECYYYFQPRENHRVNAWKNCGEVDLVSSGGHAAEFADRRIYPEKFILRHYIFLSYQHARQKYGSRTYSQYEVEELGWHGWRSKTEAKGFVAVSESALRKFVSCAEFDTSSPVEEHLFVMR